MKTFCARIAVLGQQELEPMIKRRWAGWWDRDFRPVLVEPLDNCDKCKHRFRCLLDPECEKTFESTQ